MVNAGAKLVTGGWLVAGAWLRGWWLVGCGADRALCEQKKEETVWSIRHWSPPPSPHRPSAREARPG